MSKNLVDGNHPVVLENLGDEMAYYLEALITINCSHGLDELNEFNGKVVKAAAQSVKKYRERKIVDHVLHDEE